MELPQTYNIWSKSINSLKYLSYDIGIGKSEFVAKTQFPLSLNSFVVD